MDDLPVVRIDRSLRRSLRRFGEDRLRYLDEAAAAAPVARLRFGPSSVVVVSDVAVARQLLVTDGAAWTRPPAMRFPVRLGVGENLFTKSDRAWARVQPLVAPAFRSRALAAPLARLDEIVADETAAIPVGTDLDLELVMGRIALVIAAWVFLGDRLATDRAEELADHQRHIVAWIGRRLGALSAGVPVTAGADHRRMRAHRAALERYVDGVIDRADAHDDDAATVLGALRAARVGGRALPRRELRSHILGLLLAGNETTAAALSWLLVHGAAAPEWWAALRDRPGTADDFVTESLRLHPPAWGLIRTPAAGGVELHTADRAIRVRRPGVVTVYIRGMHRDPGVWSDPTRFDPSRHADGAGVGGQMIPFGLGPRGCIGQHLALAELRALAPALARRGDVVTSGVIEESADFALRPRGGLRGRFTPPR